MPLYNSKRDAGFLLGVNREILHAYSSVEVAVYKLDLQTTQINIYEESTNKTYKPPVRVFALIQQQSKEAAPSDFGADFTRPFSIGFLTADLINANLVMEEGDIVEYDDKYFQVDIVSETNYWSGRNPETMIGIQQDGWAEHGYRISIQCQCHQTRLNELNIVDVREGVTPSPLETNNSIPKFI